MTNRHLAEINIGRIRAPLDSPEMAGFKDALDRINALADAAPGFIWRAPSVNDTSLGHPPPNPFGDPLILINLSVWSSIDALRDYTYRSDHGAFYRRRADWFERPERSPYAMWWIEAGTRPTAEEGKRRLELLWANGPSEEAFTFGWNGGQ